MNALETLRLAGALGLPVLTLFYAIDRLRPGCGRVWRLLVATWLGLGVSSILWWILMLARAHRAWLDGGIWAVACVLAFAMARISSRRLEVLGPEPPGRSQRAVVIVVILLLAVVASLATTAFVAQSIVLPHGTWDAWAIWNLKARFLVRGAAGEWKDIFDPAIGWQHPDYPLLVPLTIARGWTYVGHETTVVPVVVAAVAALAVVATAGVSIGSTRGVADGLIAAVFVCASPAFVTYAPSQCADVPLSGFVLMTFALVAEAERRQSDPRWWGIAGLSASLAAWTKNEGVVFLVVSAAACLVWVASRVVRRARTSSYGPAAFLLGAAPIAFVVATFKWLFTPGNDVMSAQSAGTLLAGLTNLDRLAVIRNAFAHELWYGGATVIGVLPLLAFYVAVRGLRRPPEPAILFAIFTSVTCLLVYASVYTVIQYDLPWSLRTTLPRLILQQTPGLVWIGIMLAR